MNKLFMNTSGKGLSKDCMISTFDCFWKKERKSHGCLILVLTSLVAFLIGCSSSTNILSRQGTPYKDIANCEFIQVPVVTGIAEFNWADALFLDKWNENIGHSPQAIYSKLNNMIWEKLAALPINGRKCGYLQTTSQLEKWGAPLETIKNMEQLRRAFAEHNTKNAYLIFPSQVMLQAHVQHGSFSPNGAFNQLPSPLGAINLPRAPIALSKDCSCDLELTLLNVTTGEVVSKVLSTSEKQEMALTYQTDPIFTAMDYCARSGLRELFGFAEDELRTVRTFGSSNGIYSMYLSNGSLFFNSDSLRSAKMDSSMIIDTAFVSNNGSIGIVLGNHRQSITIFDRACNQKMHISLKSTASNMLLSDSSTYLFYKESDKWHVVSLADLKERTDLIRTCSLSGGETFFAIVAAETEKDYLLVNFVNGRTISFRKKQVSFIAQGQIDTQ